ncbi:DUF1499 domain-containing protein [Aurantivibrio plasticivorans]
MSSDSVWTLWLVRTQIALLAVMLVALVGHKFSVLPFKQAFSAFGLGLVVVMLIALVGMLAAGYSVIFSKMTWLKPSLIAALLGFIPLVVILVFVGPSNLSVPAIHDISTDLDNPPEFVAVKRIRDSSHNSLEISEKVIELQRKAYPHIQPLESAMTPTEAFNAAMEAAAEMGWELVEANEQAMRIEAYAETKMFGFKDDIVIRISPAGNGSRIDVRSASRVGQSDLGANARRISAFMESLKQTKN